MIWKVQSRRLAIACALTMACAGLGAANAGALTVSPTGGYVFTSGAVRWTLPSNGQSLTCTSSRKSTANLSSAGTGSISINTVVFTSCTNAILGTFTVRNPQAWTVEVRLASGQVRLVITIPSGGLLISGPGCTFTMSGVITKATNVSGLPATISAASVVSDTLRIDTNNAGLLCGFFPVGLAVDYSSSLGVSPSMTVSG